MHPVSNVQITPNNSAYFKAKNVFIFIFMSKITGNKDELLWGVDRTAGIRKPALPRMISRATRLRLLGQDADRTGSTWTASWVGTRRASERL